MAAYKIFVTCGRTLKSDIAHWEAKGYELVSHAVCPNNNLSLLFKQVDKGSVNKPTEDTAIEDDNFDLIVLSALRYALPRHSYIPYTVRDYILKYWPRLQNKHWAILSDIREYICDAVKWDKDHKESESHMDRMDLDEWVKFYNKLLTLEDTWLDSNFWYLNESISLNSKNESNTN